MVQVKKKSDAKMWWARDLMKRCGEVGIVSSDEREKAWGRGVLRPSGEMS
jgi:hypothetical protein